MNPEKLRALQISPEDKRRPQRGFWSIVVVVTLALLGTVSFIQPWARDKREIAAGPGPGPVANAAGTAPAPAPAGAGEDAPAAPKAPTSKASAAQTVC